MFGSSASCCVTANSIFLSASISEASRGVVTLSGFVTESNELFEATRVAALVPGVTSVEDQIELQVFGRGGGGAAGHGP